MDPATEHEKALKKADRQIIDFLKTSNTDLVFNDLALLELPQSLRSAGQLANLTISECRIRALPEWLTELRSLTTLQLMNSGLQVRPGWIGRMPALSLLNLSGPDVLLLSDLAHTVPSLKILLLQNSTLEILPESICEMHWLKELLVHGTGLKVLPESIGKMASLNVLDLEGNALSELPHSLIQLQELSAIDLERNRFDSIPVVLQALPHLKTLNLSGNNTLPLPAEILAGHDARKILSYARHLHSKGGKKPLNEAKMILVGRGAVGKTTLVHQLVHGKFVSKTKTKGIKVSEWSVPGVAGPVTAHVWDFGGQEIMHGTHQFFLTERSLYLLVLAGREDREDEDAEYWLKLIRAFGGDSPVIVVLNKMKEHRFELNEEQLREKYPNIRAFVETDCKTNFGLRTLRRIVTDEIGHMESIRAAFPTEWFQIKQRLSDMPENFMPFDRFREICREHGEETGDDQEELARFLHILGIALNYRDDPRLRETSVLNPKWVTTGIYKLLNDETIRKRRGVLRIGDLARVLNKNDYPEQMHDFLLELMKKFELCFPLDDEGKEHLIPELLGKKQPRLGDEFEVDNCLSFEYRYGSLLPEGLLPRFIVRAYTRIEGGLRWRSGVVLSWKRARALVKADEPDRQILIRVHGPLNSRRELLALVREHFDTIHRNFKKLEPLEMIRIPQEPDLLVEYPKVEAFAINPSADFTEFHKGTIYQLDAEQILAQFELPGARRDPRFRGAASAQLALGLSVRSKKRAN